MIKAKVAGLNIIIYNKHSHLERLCKDYLCDFENADIEVSVSEKEISESRAVSKENFTDGYFESVCAYRKICHQLPSFNRLMFHSSIIEKDGKAVAFTGKSGAGKTTHTRLLLESFPENLRVVNGDKPIIHIEEDKITAYGTPWTGEEGYGENICAELQSICFILQSPDERIVSLDKGDAVSLLLNQFLVPTKPDALAEHLRLIDKLIELTDLHKMYCKAEKSSALLSYNNFFEKREK